MDTIPFGCSMSPRRGADNNVRPHGGCRCRVGVACAEVLDRLAAVELARVSGIEYKSAVERLLWWACQHAAAHASGIHHDGTTP